MDEGMLMNKYITTSCYNAHIPPTPTPTPKCNL